MENDSVYYLHAGRISLARNISLRSRLSIYKKFIIKINPLKTDLILDVGTSSVDSEEANILQKNYPYLSNITCASLSDGKDLLLKYPGINHVKIEPFKSLPFGDNFFDISYSNAVVEYVGNLSNQRFFIQELVRVSKKAFIIVPNRWFPIEHHTCLPFIHYLPKKLFRIIIANSKYSTWSNEENLNHISISDLAKSSPYISETGYGGIGFGMFASNIYGVYKK